MINKVILVGNIGADPEIRTLESGVKTARVRLATTERFVNRQTNETTEQTQWLTVIFWRGLADVVDRYVRKGSQIYIEGSIHYRDWQGSDGQRHFTTEITASELKLLGRRTDGQSSEPSNVARQTTPQYSAPQYPTPAAAPAPAPAVAPAATPAAMDDDDLPF